MMTQVFALEQALNSHSLKTYKTFMLCAHYNNTKMNFSKRFFQILQVKNELMQ